MPLRLVTPPVSQPVTLAEAKDFSRIDTNDFDAQLNAFIAAATIQVQNRTQRRYVTQTLEWLRNDWPDKIRFPIAPVQSVEFIRYVDANSETRTLESDKYIVRASGETKEIVASASYYWGWGPTGFFPAPLLPWPWPVLGPAGEPIVIRFVAGYAQGDEGLDPIPENVKLAIKVIVDWLFRNRGTAPSEASAALEDVLASLLDTERWE